MAEKSSFWHDDCFVSRGKDGMTGYGRVSINVGATASEMNGDSSSRHVSSSDAGAAFGGDSMAVKTCASQS